MTGQDAVRDQLRAVMPEHQSWCHAEAHAVCCGADDCDCGVADSLAALLPVVDRIANQRAAAELRAAADAYWRDVTFPVAREPEVRDWLRARAAAVRADELDQS